MIAWETSGSGPPVVLVHGITEDRRSWDAVVPALEERFRVLRLDLRGHGESSDASDYSPVSMAADVAEAVDAAGVESPPLLVGHSLGGAVVSVYALQAPARAVVTVDQSLRFGDTAALVHPLASALRGPGFADALSSLFEGLGEADDPEIRRKHREARQEVVLGVWGQVFESSPEDLNALAESLLPSLPVPLLAVHGSDPGADYVDWLHRLLPSAVVEVWPGGHYPHLADPARFAARLATL